MKIFSAKYGILIIGLVLLGSLALLAAKIYYPKTEQINNIEALAKAVGANRITEARLSGGFAYAPYTPLPKAEKKKTPDTDLAENQGRILNSESLILSRGEVTQNLALSSATKSSKRGAESTNYQESPLLNPELLMSAQFPNLASSVFTRGIIERAGKFNSPTPSKAAESPEFKRVAATILFAYTEQSTAEMTHAIGIVYLFLGDFDEAINYLEKALAKAPNDVTILNDLAVVYLARAENEENRKDLFDALSFITQALNLDSEMVELKFNKALLLEKLSLWETSIDEWTFYVSKEKDKQWANEAEKHINITKGKIKSNSWVEEQKQLDVAAQENNLSKVTAIVKSSPYAAYAYALEDLIPSWSDAFLQGNTREAETKLNTARLIGQILLVVNQDKLISDLVFSIDKNSNNKNWLNLAIKGYQNYKMGKNLIAKLEYDQASIVLDQAILDFSKLGDDATLVIALYQRVRCEPVKLNYDLAIKLSSQLLRIAKKNNYINIQGRNLWTVGIIQNNKYELSKSLSSKKAALAFLSATGDSAAIARMYALIAETLNLLGEDDDFWHYQYLALSHLETLPSAMGQIQTLVGVGINIDKLGKSNASICFYTEATKRLSEEKYSLMLITILIKRSYLFYKLGDIGSSSKDLEKVKLLIAKIPDLFQRDRIRDEINLLEGEYNLFKSPQLVIPYLSNLASFSKKNSDKHYLPKVYSLLADAYLFADDYVNAEKYLRLSIQEFEETRADITNEEHKITFFESPQVLYDKMISLQTKKLNNNKVAFNYAESSRSRALLDSLALERKSLFSQEKIKILLKEKASPLSLEEVQKDLPLGTVLVEYSLLKDVIVVWIVQNSSTNFLVIPNKDQDLKKMIDDLYKIINKQSKIDNWKEVSVPLYELLVTPLLKFLPINATIVFVPDKDLHKIPFSALYDKTTNQYLIQRNPIVVSPSASIFIRCFIRGKIFSDKNLTKILAIGNPTFSHCAFPRLANLKESEREAELIANFYSSAKLLTNALATKTLFLENISQNEVVHFAGHAMVDNKSPLYSKLIFAEDKTLSECDTDNGVLYAHELYGKHFLNTRLVVLAACKTGIGQTIPGEGVSSLARPFLAAGIPTVIASLWDVDDYASKEIFEAFHKNYSKKQDPVKSLQLAQISLINSENLRLHSPLMWGAFLPLGASTPK